MKFIKQIKKGIMVDVIAGKDKGKSGKVVSVDKKTGRILVDGVNLYKKHKRGTKQGEKGQVVTVSRSIAISNVKVK